jgi:hypothetical protein
MINPKVLNNVMFFWLLKASFALLKIYDLSQWKSFTRIDYVNTVFFNCNDASRYRELEAFFTGRYSKHQILPQLGIVVELIQIKKNME